MLPILYPAAASVGTQTICLDLLMHSVLFFNKRFKDFLMTRMYSNSILLG